MSDRVRDRLRAFIRERATALLTSHCWTTDAVAAELAVLIELYCTVYYDENDAPGGWFPLMVELRAAQSWDEVQDRKQWIEEVLSA